MYRNRNVLFGMITAKKTDTRIISHLQDVQSDDKLGGFALCLFALETGRSDTQDPFYFVLQRLFTGLFVHLETCKTP